MHLTSSTRTFFFNPVLPCFWGWARAQGRALGSSPAAAGHQARPGTSYSPRPKPPRNSPTSLAYSRLPWPAPSSSSGGGGRPPTALPGQIPQAEEHPLYAVKLPQPTIGPWRRRSKGLRGDPRRPRPLTAARARSGHPQPQSGQHAISTPSTTSRTPPRQPKHDPKPRELRAHR